MSHSQNRIEELFAEAAALPPAEREGFLARACGGERELRSHVEKLLQAHDHAQSFMKVSPAEEIAPARTVEVPPPEGAGERVGRYKLLQKIGEGGCGIVYMAEQEEPVRRRVALKVIKLGMDTKEVIARFEAERQALALMDHPNIAKVLDAGATEAGRPYFVMELVRGIAITRFCDEQNLPTSARLELFTLVCHAVQHAHQKGIIHRDIKPSNILVTLHDGKPVPKIIDFGIAKATAGRLTDNTLFTAFEQFIGTPAYMSPEQAEMSGLDIDTRSDIYSLGVLLYELLTGRPPFDPKSLLSAGLDEIRRIIREVDPPRMSTRLSTLSDLDRATIAKNRAIAPGHLSTLLRGDLDWIVMRCLEKDRTRRYETANGLALDVLRHLHDEPVLARPPSTAYRFRKLLRRNKLTFGAAAAVVVALLAGLGVAVWRYQHEKIARAAEVTARELAERRRTEVESINRFLVSDMLGSANPEIAQGREITVKEVLGNAAARVEQAFKGNPLIEASIRHAIGVTYQGIGQFDEADRQIGTALEARKRLLGSEHPDTLESQSALGSIRRSQQRLPDAEKILRETRDVQIRTLGLAHEQTLKTTDQLCLVLVWSRRKPEGEPLARESWIAAKKQLGPDHRLTLQLLHKVLGTSSFETLRKEGEALYAELLAAQRRTLGSDHPEALGTMNDYGRHLSAIGKPGEGSELLRTAFERATHVLGPTHPYTAQIQSNHGFVLRDAGKNAEGIAMVRQSVEASRRGAGVGALHTQDFLNGLGNVLAEDKRWNEVEPLMREWIPLMRAAGIPYPNYFGNCLTLLGMAANESGQFVEAEAALREAILVREKHFGGDDYRVAISRGYLGAALLGQKRFADAEAALQASSKALARSATSMSNAAAPRLAVMRSLAQLYADWNKPTLALHWQKSRHEEDLVQADSLKWEKLEGDTLSKVVDLRTQAAVLTKDKRLAVAIPLREQMVKILREKLGDENTHTLAETYNLAEAYHESGRVSEALPMAELILKVRRERFGADFVGTLRCAELVARVYGASNRLPEAVQLQEESLALRRARFATSLITITSMDVLADLYRKMNNPERAEKISGEAQALRKDLEAVNAKATPAARPTIYDESADGAKQIADALARAKKEHKTVLLQFGANWCVWCHKLHKLFGTDPTVAAALQRDFVVVLIDVNKEHNKTVDAKFGQPTRHGLPVLVVLNADGQHLTTQETGSLEEGAYHSPEKVMAFLKKWSPAR